MSEESRKPLTSDDASYLQEYVHLCESLLRGAIDLEGAETDLKKLNDNYKKITNKVRKDRVMGSNLTDYEGWVPSAVC